VRESTKAENLLRERLYHGPVLSLISAPDRDPPSDFLRLPVHYPALLQKLRSLATSYWFRDDLVLEIGPWMLRPAFKELIRQGSQAVALTDKEVEILIYLYRAGGKIILVIFFLRKFGAITRTSRPIRLKPIFIGSGKRSRWKRKSAAF